MSLKSEIKSTDLKFIILDPFEENERVTKEEIEKIKEFEEMLGLDESADHIRSSRMLENTINNLSRYSTNPIIEKNIFLEQDGKYIIGGYIIGKKDDNLNPYGLGDLPELSIILLPNIGNEGNYQLAKMLLEQCEEYIFTTLNCDEFEINTNKNPILVKAIKDRGYSPNDASNQNSLEDYYKKENPERKMESKLHH